MEPVSRWDELRRVLRDSSGAQSLGHHLSEIARDTLRGDHGSVSLHASGELLLLASSDDVAGHLDEQQTVVGQGPIFSVVETGTPTVVADTAEKMTLTRWPVFGPILSAAGIGSLLCFPLVSGAAHIGAISSYRDTPWFPDPDTYTDGLVLAALTTEIVLRMQAGWTDDGRTDELESSLRDRAIVNQAAGMTAELLGIGVAEALVRLRANAFAAGQPLAVLARRVVSGETALEA